MRPAPLFVRYALVFLALSPLAAWQYYFLLAWGLAVLVFVILLAQDAIRIYLQAVPEMSRRVDSALPLGVWQKVQLRFSFEGKQALKLRVFDFPSSIMSYRFLPFDLTLEPHQVAEQEYEIFPNQRGYGPFEPAQVLMISPRQFWHRSVRCGPQTMVKVYPNFQAVAKYSMLDAGQRLAQLGIHKRRRRGEGGDFHQLREFVQGDSMRQIDWKASSRMRKIIAREFRDERDQRVVFMVDCGQSMRSKDGVTSHFDQTLNAVLLMASVALRNGDAVGMLTFGGEPRHLAPRKGAGQLNLLLDTLFDIQPSLQTADFNSVARAFLMHAPKRTLLVMVTNLKEEDESELIPVLRSLRRRHMVLLASLRERVLDEVMDAQLGESASFEGALKLAGAMSYVQGRRRLFDSLKGQGVLLLDVLPQQLPVTLVNAYLDIKASGAL